MIVFIKKTEIHNRRIKYMKQDQDVRHKTTSQGAIKKAAR